MKLALDTNILAYAEGVNGAAMQRRAIALLEALEGEEIHLPAQALGELGAVLVRKAGLSRRLVQDAVLSWLGAYPTIATTYEVMSMALSLAADHDLGMWDSVILAAAAQARCRVLLSQDLQHGFTWNGVTVIDPFSQPTHPLLEPLLRGL